MYTDYYHVYKRTSTVRQETEAPIYNMILEIEAIELHKLKVLIELHQRFVLFINALSTFCFIDALAFLALYLSCDCCILFIGIINIFY
jgi:hypothetical protein